MKRAVLLDMGAFLCLDSVAYASCLKGGFRMKKSIWYLCQMPFFNRAGRYGIELAAILANPEDCEKERDALAKGVHLANVVTALPRVKIVVQEDGAVILFKRKDNTILPCELRDLANYVRQAPLSRAIDKVPKVTHQSCHESDGLWEEWKTVNVGDLPELLTTIKVGETYNLAAMGGGYGFSTSFVEGEDCCYNASEEDLRGYLNRLFA